MKTIFCSNHAEYSLPITTQFVVNCMEISGRCKKGPLDKVLLDVWVNCPGILRFQAHSTLNQVKQKLAGGTVSQTCCSMASSNLLVWEPDESCFPCYVFCPCFRAQVSSKYGTQLIYWTGHSAIYVRRLLGWRCISSGYTVLISPKKDKTVIHCCDPALAVLVMLVSRSLLNLNLFIVDMHLAYH